jgi:Asp-tRNA(Asn)/Glu-tRNA(Gln) amidotransferase A subunit family amidase
MTDITVDQIAAAESLAALQFTDAERELMLPDVEQQRARYEQLREVPLPNHVAPALGFDPRPPAAPVRAERPTLQLSDTVAPALPDDLEQLAFAPVTQLAQLIRARQVSSLALTEMYLRRLKRHDPALRCVVTLTEERALAQARQADAEIAAGRYRGPLHGIPWGAKDLLAARGYPTTWGAEPYVDQRFDEDATVVSRLADAGAVLVAKLSVGALAWGDVWFGGRTNNPWDLTKGSSGSSAGSAAATAAGLVGFAIGTETYGSIVSPVTTCGVTGLRPTFGRVSRRGCMALSWSLDKIGPICRSVEDCAVVLAAIDGPDDQDGRASVPPFAWDGRASIAGLRVGYVASAFDATPEDDKERARHENDARALEDPRRLGLTLIPIELPQFPLEALQIILNAEAAAAFDELTRSDRDDMLTRQVRDAWPNVFRQSRLIPAVEYIQANRIRALLMRSMERLMGGIDVYVAPSFCANLLLTNLTGHPAVVVPNGFTAEGMPTSITFTGGLYGEAAALALAKAYQDAAGHHLRHPAM